MSAIAEHFERLNESGKINLRQIAGQLVESMSTRDLIGRDWRATRVHEEVGGTVYRVEFATFDEDQDDYTFSPTRKYPGSEINSFIEERLREDDVWAVKPMEVKA